MTEVQKIFKITLVLNVLVCLIKFVIGFQAQSLSIIGDAVHSCVDGLNNVIALFMTKLAAEPPDEEHHYGHAKFETLGALIIVAFLAIASFELIEKSIVRFFNPDHHTHIEIHTIYFLLTTLIINILVWIYEIRSAKRLGSGILEADAEHTFSDILVTISILIGSFFISKGYLWIDSALGLVIAIVIARGGVKILQQSVPILVDQAWLKIDDIKDLIYSTPKIISFENFRSRKSHQHCFIEITLKFDTDSLREAHELSHQLEEKIIEKFGQAEVTIHIEPK